VGGGRKPPGCFEREGEKDKRADGMAMGGKQCLEGYSCQGAVSAMPCHAVQDGCRAVQVRCTPTHTPTQGRRVWRGGRVSNMGP